MSQYSPSANTYVREIDLSERAEAASTSVGAIVMRSGKGPVNTRTLITSIPDFIDRFGTPNPRIGFGHYSALSFLEKSNQLYVTRVINTDALTAGAYWTVDDANAVNPITSLNNFDDGGSNPLGVYDPLNTIGFNPLDPGIENVLGFFCAENPGLWNNEIFIRIRPSTKLGVATPDDPYEFYVDIFLNYTSPRQIPNESYRVSRDYRLNGMGEQMNIEEVINNRSKIVRFKANPYAAPLVKILNTPSEYLGGASNGTPATESQIIQGWELYRDPENVDVSILINGGLATPPIQLIMDEICDQRMDCIAVLDVPSPEQEVANAVLYRRNDLNLNSSYSALYSCDLKVYDQYNDLELYVPPSGLVAAAFADTDVIAETWYAPAGLNRGLLSVLGVRHIYNQGDRDVLDDNEVNAIRYMPSISSYAIWGAGTLQAKKSALSNVNVRRLMIILEKSLKAASLYSIYEPNDEILWGRLTELSERFLKPIKEGRGLYWYEVVCNELNNTPEVIAAGNVALDIYVDPVIPAKRIHINAIINKTGSTITASEA